MPTEVADLAILDHIGKSGQQVSIAAYGGEPLLNLSLLKHCIEFSEEHTRKAGKDLIFSITTNGTLLTEETARYLVEHNVTVAISLDGAKEAHDRYRVFHDKTQTGKRVGSFRIVMKNIRRFIELYPDYELRGIFMVLTRPYDTEATQQLIDELWPFFPLSRVSFVSHEYGSTFEKQGSRPKQVGCAPDSACGDSGCSSSDRATPGATHDMLTVLTNSSCSSGCGCSKAPPPSTGNRAALQEHLLPLLVHSEGSNCSSCSQSPTPSASDSLARSVDAVQQNESGQSVAPASNAIGPSSNGNVVQISEMMNRFKEARLKHGAKALSQASFVSLTYRDAFSRVHNRRIDRQRMTKLANYKCAPGVIRLFVDIRGKYFTCERCENTELMSLGDVWHGMDGERSQRLMEVYRHIADCGNCIAHRTCANCFTSFFQRTDSDMSPIGEAFDFKCRQSRSGVASVLSTYTEIMEQDPQAFSDFDLTGDEEYEFRVMTDSADSEVVGEESLDCSFV